MIYITHLGEERLGGLRSGQLVFRRGVRKLFIIAGIVIVVLIVLFVIFFLSTYTVVKPNEAHVVVFMGKGRRIYSPSMVAGKTFSTAYFKIPSLMKVNILPLANVKMELPGFRLVDKDVAPFTCEVVCWFRIKSPADAIEKIDIDGEFAESVLKILEAQIRGVARAAAMKQSILQIMQNRKDFGDIVEEEVNGTLDEWGLELVKLEIIDFADTENSQVIQNYENKRESQIEAESRKEVAAQKKDAEIAEAQAARESGIAKAEADQKVQQAGVERDKQVNISKEKAAQEVATASMDANAQTVEAERKLQVGRASYNKDAKIIEAEGERTSTIRLGEGQAESNRVKGQANAQVIRLEGEGQAAAKKAQGLAEAVAIDKKAEALKKYNDAGINLEKIRATVEIEKTKFVNLGAALQKAQIQIINGGETDLFGMAVGPKQGAGFATALKAFEQVSGIDVKDAAKTIVKKVAGK